MSATDRPLLEICVDTPDGLATASASGADRIELCADLGVGGLTPAPGLIAAARDVPVPVFVMIRPRQGDFIFGPRDRDAMLADIAAVRQAGLAGVVLGASLPDRSLDVNLLRLLREAAHGLRATLHRAFDLTPDLSTALEQAISLGFDNVLTSGGLSDAVSGHESLRRLVAQAADRIVVMPGGGITPENVVSLVRATGVKAVHASAKVAIEQDTNLVRWGFCASRTFLTHGPTVAAIRTALERETS